MTSLYTDRPNNIVSSGIGKLNTRGLTKAKCFHRLIIVYGIYSYFKEHTGVTIFTKMTFRHKQQRWLNMQTIQAVYVWCNNEARSRNHCFHEKARNVTYSECVCNLYYHACKAHAHYYIGICDTYGCTIFFRIISQAVRFSEESYWTQNVFWIYLHILSENFLILRIIQLDITINVHKTSCKVHVILVRF
jgi:hypothetical protein